MVIGTVNTDLLRFKSGVPNLHFIKYPHILVNYMNFLQTAQYDCLSVIESRLLMLILNPGSIAADDAVLLRCDKLDTSTLCLVKQATVAASYSRRKESSFLLIIFQQCSGVIRISSRNTTDPRAVICATLRQRVPC